MTASRAVPASLSAHFTALAAAAQSVYDAWDQTGEDGDPELGFGGICQDIAAALSSVLDGVGIKAATVEAQCGEQHVFVVAAVEEGVYEVDIPFGRYERGAGYCWSRIPGVTFDADDIATMQLSANPADFTQYAEDFADMGP